MRRFLVFLLLLPAIAEALDFSEAEQLLTSYDHATLVYLNERMEYENSISLDEKNGCYALPDGGVTQIVRINKDGVIDLVVSKVQNSKSKCFEKAYLGTKFKAPPSSPIYMQQEMGYGCKPKCP